MVKAAGRFAFMMDDDAFGLNPASRALEATVQAQAEVNIFLAVDVDDIKALLFGEILRSYGHTGACNRLEAAAAVSPRVFGLLVRVNRVAQWAFGRENHTDALNGAIGVEQLGLHRSHVGLIQCFDQRGEPVRRDGGVVVQKDNGFALTGGKAEIAAMGKVKVLGVSYEADIGMLASQISKQGLGGG